MYSESVSFAVKSNRIPNKRKAKLKEMKNIHRNTVHFPISRASIQKKKEEKEGKRREKNKIGPR